ncbi:hypothetical protein [Neomoorella mulderi]|uniref:hypothetical protein n=1 Tax=Neomoorella mulderi TaxID=202604 RepID=UPI001372D9FE|nr:hypothetical protein [Moorella mulderi]
MQRRLLNLVPGMTLNCPLVETKELAFPSPTGGEGFLKCPGQLPGKPGINFVVFVKFIDSM